MPINKPHLEFHRVDMSSGWSTPAGYSRGIEQKVLAGILDEERRSGSRTRLLRFAPGVFTTEPWLTLTVVGIVYVSSIPWTIYSYYRLKRAPLARRAESAERPEPVPLPTRAPLPLGEANPPPNEWRH